MNRRRRARTVIAASVVLVAVILSIAAPLRDNPFEVARLAIADAGGWPASDVVFRRGSYGFLPFLVVCTVRAEAWVTEGDSRRAAEVELRHLPLLGWSVREFQVAAPAVLP